MPETIFSLRLGASELAPQQVRHELEELGRELDPGVLDRLLVVATELITNSVRHSGARERGEEILVEVRLAHPTLLVKVCDKGPGFEPTPRQPDPLAEGGRGLLLVDLLSERWGTSARTLDGERWNCTWACFGADSLGAAQTLCSSEG